MTNGLRIHASRAVRWRPGRCPRPASGGPGRTTCLGGRGRGPARDGRAPSSDAAAAPSAPPASPRHYRRLFRVIAVVGGPNQVPTAGRSAREPDEFPPLSISDCRRPACRCVVPDVSMDPSGSGTGRSRRRRLGSPAGGSIHPPGRAPRPGSSSTGRQRSPATSIADVRKVRVCVIMCLERWMGAENVGVWTETVRVTGQKVAASAVVRPRARADHVA